MQITTGQWAVTVLFGWTGIAMASHNGNEINGIGIVGFNVPLNTL